MTPTDLMSIAAAGMRAQTARMRVVAENIANAEAVGDTPGAAPYRRNVPIFKAELDREMGATVPRMERARPDQSPFTERYEPGHPAANAEGVVLYPNVRTLIEMMDMRSAQRAYEANLNIIEAGRSMVARTLDVLRR